MNSIAKKLSTLLAYMQKSLALEVYPEKSIYVKPNLGRINVPVFFIKTPINRGVFEEIFGETLKA
ncbi:hypothetical protein HRG13_15040 [Enterococcus faecalis]|nr:hypothetical protein [Enterococcus faecalis]